MKPDCAGGIGSLSNSTVVTRAGTRTCAVPGGGLKSTRFVPGSVSMKSTTAPVGIASCTDTTLPVWYVPRMRQDHVDGSDEASFAVVLSSEPPLTRKLNCRPT